MWRMWWNGEDLLEVGCHAFLQLNGCFCQFTVIVDDGVNLRRHFIALHHSMHECCRCAFKLAGVLFTLPLVLSTDGSSSAANVSLSLAEPACEIFSDIAPPLYGVAVCATSIASDQLRTVHQF